MQTCVRIEIGAMLCDCIAEPLDLILVILIANDPPRLFQTFPFLKQTLVLFEEVFVLTKRESDASIARLRQADKAPMLLQVLLEPAYIRIQISQQRARVGIFVIE